MPEICKVSIEATSEVHILPDMWPAGKLNKVLELAEFDDAGQIPESELFDMCVMAVQELDHQRAGELVLEAVFGDQMRPGVRQNLVDDLEEDQPWDDVAELSHQKGVFEALVLLQQAFPNRYGTPDALKLGFTLSAPRAAVPHKSTEAWLLDILAGCLTERDILNRLYGDEIRQQTFEGAEHIIWWCHQSEPQMGIRSVELISSRQWFASFQRGDSFEIDIQGVRR